MLFHDPLGRWRGIGAASFSRSADSISSAGSEDLEYVVGATSNIFSVSSAYMYSVSFSGAEPTKGSLAGEDPGRSSGCARSGAGSGNKDVVEALAALGVRATPGAQIDEQTMTAALCLIGLRRDGKT